MCLQKTIIFLLVSSVLLFSCQVAAAAKVSYISPSGSDGTGDGSQQKPFKSIFKAVQVSNDGDTVILLPGDYDSNGNTIEINKSVTIKSSEGPHVTKIRSERKVLAFLVPGSVEGISFLDTYIGNKDVLVTVTNVIMVGRGFTRYPIQNNENEATKNGDNRKVIAINAKEFKDNSYIRYKPHPEYRPSWKISHSIISNIQDSAVITDQVGNVYVDNCQIDGCTRYGFMYDSYTNLYLTNTLIINTKQTAIYPSGAVYTSLDNVTVANSGSSGIFGGAGGRTGEPLIKIRNSKFINNDEGVMCYHGAIIDISNSEFRGNNYAFNSKQNTVGTTYTDCKVSVIDSLITEHKKAAFICDGQYDNSFLVLIRNKIVKNTGDSQAAGICSICNFIGIDNIVEDNVSKYGYDSTCNWEGWINSPVP